MCEPPSTESPDAPVAQRGMLHYGPNRQSIVPATLTLIAFCLGDFNSYALSEIIPILLCRHTINGLQFDLRNNKKRSKHIFVWLKDFIGGWIRTLSRNDYFGVKARADDLFPSFHLQPSLNGAS